MTKTKVNETGKGFRRLGDFVFRQNPDGTTVMSLAPDQSKQKPIKGIKTPNDHLERLRKAASYASFAAKAQPIYAELAQRVGKSAYQLARADWFHPPVIHEVRCGENEIRIQATDNIMVVKVVLRILDGQGKLLEAGQATRQAEDWWQFLPKRPGKIVTVEAWDLAGNVTKLIV